MESVKNDKQQQSEMIIVMRSPSNDKNSGIASLLSDFFQCPLIDEENIALSLQKHLPSSSNQSTSSTKVSDDLPLKIVTQISQTQLQLKPQVIINASLSQRSHYDHLLRLANQKQACLVMVECTTTPQSDQGHEYDVGHVAKLSYNMEKPFNDLVREIERVAVSHKNVHEGKKYKLGRSLKVDRTITPQRCFAEAHAHEFCFTKQPKNEKLCCNSCQKPISGPTYQCTECDNFILHQSCAQSQQELDFSILKRGLFYRESNPSAYKFPEEYKCRHCEHFSSECNDCLLQSHIKWGILPTIYSYEKHSHPLSFVIMPFWFDYEYKCIACERYGKFVSYKCYSCHHDLHIFCAFSLLRFKALGPWGNPYNPRWDDGVFSTVRQLKLSVKEHVTSIQIEYDKDGTSVWSALHGITHPEEEIHEIKLDYPDEYLTAIQGYFHEDLGAPMWSLAFKSNRRTYGPYGVRKGKFFSSPLSGRKIVGLHGTIDEHLSAIGAYVELVQQ